MPVDLRETRLPGIGVKYTFRTAQGGRLSVIMHNDGQREIYFYRRTSDDDPTAVIELHDDEARQLGAVIGGAYERPKIVEELELALGELQIEWIDVPETSPAIDRTLAECGLRAKTGVTVIAILREPEPVSGASRRT
jgi:TrkA domain protein